MKIKLNYLYLIFSIAWSTVVCGQELNCNVTIDATQVPDIQSYLIEDMKQTITNFLNTRNWTEDTYKPEERIKCNLAISIVSVPSQGSYSATAQIQASRPVFGTTYETVTLNYFDKQFNFDLNPGQPLNYNENIYNSRLASLLSFYAYVILSVDYDSFGKLSGSKYIEKAFNLAGVAREAGEGWLPGDQNNRAALAENLNSQQLVPFREGWYTYHRVAMDKFIKEPNASRELIYAYLETIKEINKQKPYSILIKSFFMGKRDELISIYKEAEMPMKNKVLPLLRELDAVNSEKYQQIIKN
jgi:hypothetical protein